MGCWGVDLGVVVWALNGWIDGHQKRQRDHMRGFGEVARERTILFDYDNHLGGLWDADSARKMIIAESLHLGSRRPRSNCHCVLSLASGTIGQPLGVSSL